MDIAGGINGVMCVYGRLYLIQFITNSGTICGAELHRCGSCSTDGGGHCASIANRDGDGGSVRPFAQRGADFGAFFRICVAWRVGRLVLHGVYFTAYLFGCSRVGDCCIVGRG